MNDPAVMVLGEKTIHNMFYIDVKRGISLSIVNAI